MRFDLVAVLAAVMVLSGCEFILDGIDVGQAATGVDVVVAAPASYGADGL